MRVLITEEERRARNREAVRRYHARHPEVTRERKRAYLAKHPEKLAEWNRAHRDRLRALIRQIKLERGCIDCGYRENADALQFDHVRGTKVVNISRVRSYKVLLAEVAKCDVRCGNCHLIRTAHQYREKAACAF